MEAPQENLRRKKLYFLSDSRLLGPDSVLTLFDTAEEAVLSLFYHPGGQRLDPKDISGDYFMMVFYVSEDLYVDARRTLDYTKLTNLDCRNVVALKARIPVVIRMIFNGDQLGESYGNVMGVNATVLCKPDPLILIRTASMDALSLVSDALEDLASDLEQGVDVTPENLLVSIRTLLGIDLEKYVTLEDPELLQSGQVQLSPVASPSSQYKGDDQFERLPAVVIGYMALGMTPEAIGRFCQSSKNFNLTICENDLFWAQKSQIDYPGMQKPESYTWKKFYKAISQMSIDQRINNLKEGLSTIELIMLLLAFARRPPGNFGGVAVGGDQQGGADYDQRGTILITLSGIAGVELRNEKAVLKSLEFDRERNVTNDITRRFIEKRGEIYDVVNALIINRQVSDPAMYDGQHGPIRHIIRAPDGRRVIAFYPLSMALLKRIVNNHGIKLKVYRAVGSTRGDLYKTYRKVLAKLWSLTDRNSDPMLK